VGAVSTGDIWQLALLHRETKHIQQGLMLYRVPDDLETLVRILVQVFQRSPKNIFFLLVIAIGATML